MVFAEIVFVLLVAEAFVHFGCGKCDSIDSYTMAAPFFAIAFLVEACLVAFYLRLVTVLLKGTTARHIAYGLLAILVLVAAIVLGFKM